MEKLNWKSLVILYENEDSLVKLQEVLKLPNSFDGVKITMRQLYTDTDDHRPLLKEIKKSGETRIILVSLLSQSSRTLDEEKNPIFTCVG